LIRAGTTNRMYQCFHHIGDNGYYPVCVAETFWVNSKYIKDNAQKNCPLNFTYEEIGAKIDAFKKHIARISGKE
jgi:hypothetical protein